MNEDWADRHVARWREHWVDVPFDDDVEGITVRISRLDRRLSAMVKPALADAGLQDFEFRTLHALMIRDTPGVASPTQLADSLDVSAAGMTGRLDALERAGWIQRAPSADDRRRVVVEVTKAGIEVWRGAMGLIGAREKDLVTALSANERQQLIGLLRKLALRADDQTTG